MGFKHIPLDFSAVDNRKFYRAFESLIIQHQAKIADCKMEHTENLSGGGSRKRNRISKDIGWIEEESVHNRSFELHSGLYLSRLLW